MKEIKEPYRKNEYMDDPDEAAIKKMEEEIAAEKKFSIRLPEEIKHGEVIPFFKDALKNPDIGPEGVIFYSLATGILKFSYDWSHGENRTYHYKNPNNNLIRISLSTKDNKDPVIVRDVINKQKAEQKKYEETEKNIDNFANTLENIKEANMEELQKHQSKLKEIRTRLDEIISILENKSETEK